MGNLEEKLDIEGIDIQDQAGSLYALFQVWYNEDEKETEERREDRRTAKIEESITDECQVAFTSLAEMTSNISEMAGEEEEEEEIEELADDDIDDKCYQFYDGDVAVEMCLDEYQEVVIGEESMVEIKGNLKNIGNVGLCNVTFDIQDIDSATDSYPETLPKVPDVFTPDSEYKFGATIPIDEESHVLPYVDLWNSFYTCEVETAVVEKEEEVEEEEEEEVEEVEEEEEVVVEEVEEVEEVVEKEEKVNEPVKQPIDWEQWITPETACFYDCYDQIVAEFGGEENIEECPGLNYLFTHDCHSCDPFVVEASKNQCIEYGCSEEECAYENDTKTSGSVKISTSIALVLTGMMALFRRD